MKPLVSNALNMVTYEQDSYGNSPSKRRESAKANKDRDNNCLPEFEEQLLV